MSDQGSRGWSHAEPEQPLLLCADHVRTTKRLDDHRSNQIARACPQCYALNHRSLR